jgi:hypothetical protein
MHEHDLGAIRSQLEAQEIELTRLTDALRKYSDVVLEISDDVDAQFGAIASGLRARPTPRQPVSSIRA